MQLIASCGRHLRCLVEDDEVERWVGREEVADGERAHHQARLQVGEKPGICGEQHADRHVPALLGRLSSEQRHF